MSVHGSSSRAATAGNGIFGAVSPRVPAKAEALVQRLLALLKRGSPLKVAVSSCFRCAAARGQLTPDKLPVFGSAVSQVLSVAESVFVSIQAEFVRFDFGGNGYVGNNECYRLVRDCIRQYLVSRGGVPSEYPLRNSSIEAEGFRAVTSLSNSGRFGVVTLVTDRLGRQLSVHAVERWRVDPLHLEERLEDLAALAAEAEVAAGCGGDAGCIAGMLDIFQDISRVYFVQEPCYGGDLHAFVDRSLAAGSIPSEKAWRMIFRKCFTALRHLEACALTHCDVREANIMLQSTGDDEPIAVLADIGLSLSSTPGLSGLIGTPGYIPPETWQTGKWYPKGDCFSLGVVIFQVKSLCREGLFTAGTCSQEEIQAITCSRDPPYERLKMEPAQFQTLLRRLLCKKQPDRITAAQALTCPWFTTSQPHSKQPLLSQATQSTGVEDITSEHRLERGFDTSGELTGTAETAKSLASTSLAACPVAEAEEEATAEAERETRTKVAPIVEKQIEIMGVAGEACEQGVIIAHEQVKGVGEKSAAMHVNDETRLHCATDGAITNSFAVLEQARSDVFGAALAATAASATAAPVDPISWGPCVVPLNQVDQMVERSVSDTRLLSSPTPVGSAGAGVAFWALHDPTGGIPPEKLAQRIEALLRQGNLMRQAVSSCLRLTASTSLGGSNGCEDRLLPADFVHFSAVLARALAVPEIVLRRLDDDMDRFDFDGCGSLATHECVKLVRFCLGRYLAEDLSVGSQTHVVRWASMASEGYQAVSRLESGGQGTTQLVLDSGGSHLCLKLLVKEQVSSLYLRELVDDFAILREAADTCIARTFDVFQDSDCICFVGEPYYGGDFTTLVNTAVRQGVTPTEAWWQGVFGQCFQGLVHMHMHAMLHCDIKEPNLILKVAELRRPEVMIIDAGLAQACSSGRQGVVGTPGYIPPESWHTGHWYPKGDCFSMGVVMLQLLVDIPEGGVFTSGADSLEEVREITCARAPPLGLIPQQYGELLGLVTQLLEKRRTARISALEASRCTWLRSAASAGGGQAAPAAAPPVPTIPVGSVRGGASSSATTTHPAVTAAPS